MLRRANAFFFFNDTATTEIYTLSLHDALPISRASTPPTPASSRSSAGSRGCCATTSPTRRPSSSPSCGPGCRASSCWRSRSEEHTSELQSRQYLVCRLLLEKKNYKVAEVPHRQ